MFRQANSRATSLLILLAMAMSSQAQQVLEVFPSGLFPDDVARVAAALTELGNGVDGVIVLRACAEDGTATAFNFGTDPDPLKRARVTPRSDWTGAIEFHGKDCGDARAVIEGGNVPILFDRRDRIRIANIEFRGAWEHAISINESTEAEIVDNVIVDTVGNFTNSLVRPIQIAANVSGSRDEVTGQVTVRGNRVEGASGWFAQGIAIVSTNAEVLVAENIISGVNVGVQLLYYQKPVQVFSNTISAAVPRPNFFAAGIEVAAGTDDTASVNISNNHISVSDARGVGFANGVDLAALAGVGGDFRNSLVYGNEIQLKNAENGIFVTVVEGVREVSNNIIARNTVSGSVADGIFTYVYPGASGLMLNNRIVGNHLSGMQPDAANSHIWLGPETEGTLCLAEIGNIVVDQGVNNIVITGMGSRRTGSPLPGN